MQTGSTTAAGLSRRLTGHKAQEGKEMKNTLITANLNRIVMVTAFMLAVVAAAGSAL